MELALLATLGGRRGTYHFLQNMKAIFFLALAESSIWLSMGEDIVTRWACNDLEGEMKWMERAGLGLVQTKKR